MNINSEIKKLQEITGIKVSQDEYTGEDDKYIVFTYTDEYPVFWGDDKVLADEAILNVALYTPPRFNYMELKHLIRDYLETVGIVSDISTWLDIYTNKNNREITVRHTNFNVTITKER